MSVQRRITLTQEEDGGWVAVDEDAGEAGVASQGATRADALANLDEAIELHEGGGRPVTDDDLREWGIDPETVADDAAVPDAPWFEDTDEEDTAE